MLTGDQGGLVGLSSAFFPESFERLVLSGRSSGLSRFYEAFPFRITEQWQVYHNTIIDRTIGHHSSGYCCGFKPHSLFSTTILQFVVAPNRSKICIFQLLVIASYQQLLTVSFVILSRRSFESPFQGIYSPVVCIFLYRNFLPPTRSYLPLSGPVRRVVF